MADSDGSTGTKRCPRCDSVKSLEAFGLDPRRAQGRRTWCRECHNAANRDYSSRNADWRRKSLKEWRAANPEKVKAQSKRRIEKCKDDLYARTRAWWASDPERARLTRRKNAAKYPDRVAARWRTRRARKQNAPGAHTAQDIADIIKLQFNKCAYCKKNLSCGYHVDHIVPLSKGGSNDRRNLQITCAACNIRKNDKDPLDYARQTGRLL